MPYRQCQPGLSTALYYSIDARLRPTAIDIATRQYLTMTVSQSQLYLKPLNLFIKKEKFKMETTRSIRKALPPGRIFPHSGTSRFSEVPLDNGRGQSVPVQGSAFRTVTSPKGVLSGHRSPGHPAVLGRLSGTHPRTGESSVPGLPSELGQVGTYPDSEVCIPRRSLRSSSRAS